MADEDASCLALILDANLWFWVHSRGNANSFPHICDQITVFLKAFLLLNRHNRVVVIGCNESQSSFLFPSPGTASTDRLSECVFSGLKAVMTEAIQQAQSGGDGAAIVNRGSLLAGALSQALCYTNAILKKDRKISARVLVIQASTDTPSQYVSIMNSIFSAEKQAIPVDTCMLHAEDSVCMQQAASRTQALYTKLPVAPPSQEKSDLLSHLMMVFLPCKKSRPYLILPQLDKVDLRATCFCHNTPVSQACVCPVCLAIYCEQSVLCASCGTRFPLHPIHPTKRKRPDTTTTTITTTATTTATTATPATQG